MSIKAICAGSFDPVTNGHTDVIMRAAQAFDEVIVGVLNNSAKKPLFTTEERVEMIREVMEDVPNVRVIAFDGLLVDLAHREGAKVLVRGLRAVTDFEYEMQIAQTNRVIAPDIDTVFFTTNLKYSYLSSSIVKEIASYGENIAEFVDPRVAERVKAKYKL
jgi:pantetheine-phosphate adenylyltransferase